MNRNMKLVHKRQSLVGIFITRKRAKGYTIKKAVEEAAVIFSVGIKTAYNDYNKYRKHDLINLSHQNSLFD